MVDETKQPFCSRLSISKSNPDMTNFLNSKSTQIYNIQSEALVQSSKQLDLLRQRCDLCVGIMISGSAGATICIVFLLLFCYLQMHMFVQIHMCRCLRSKVS